MWDVVLLGRVRPDFLNWFPVADRTVLLAIRLGLLC